MTAHDAIGKVRILKLIFMKVVTFVILPYSREKGQFSQDLQRQICGENGQFHGNFAGIFGVNLLKSKAERFQKKNVGRMSNSGKERKHLKVHPTQF